MDTGKGFKRSFLILTNEDAGYEAGQKPSGYIRLEVREGRGKLHANVQNLRPGNGKFVYKLYLLRTGKEGIVTVCTGHLSPEPNKAELEWSFDPGNVGASGYGIEEFGSAVVLVEYTGRPDNAVICPLAAYRNKKEEWRSGLMAAILKKRMGVPQPAQNKQMQQKDEMQQADQTQQAYKTQQKDQMSQEAQMPQKDQMQQEDEMQQEAQMPQKDQMPQTGQTQQTGYMPQTFETAMPKIQQSSEILPLQAQPPYQQLTQEQPQIPQMQTPAALPNPQQEQLYVQYQNNLGQIDTGCVYLNGNICGAFVNNSASAANPCDACRMHNEHKPAAVQPAANISQLREEIDRCFEEADPFHSKRSDYLWWKVTNPVNLNNILYQCNIRSPLLFNPAVMMAHYKYRHLIIGIFLHKARQKQYVVCGVPGMHMVDRKPFGEMNRWVQAEGNRPRYGAFGYWLVYIDPDNGKILNMSQE